MESKIWAILPQQSAIKAEEAAMGSEIRPLRLSEWAERNWARVAFIAHALLPDALSSRLISQKLQENGLPILASGQQPGAYLRWLEFPVVPRQGQGQPVWVDFYIIPLHARDYLAALKTGQAYRWAEEVALAAIAEAAADGVSLTLGWGALTKLATGHGEKFLAAHPDLAAKFSSTHGDAGTTALTLEAVRSAGFQQGFRAAVIGANGAIGEAISRELVRLSPSSIALVGKPDQPGEMAKLERLERLRKEVLAAVPVGQHVDVLVSQDKATACINHHSQAVIVATTGMELVPEEIPSGAVVFDITTPPACRPHRGWQGRLVLTDGCGELPELLIPRGFGMVGGSVCYNVGAGGVRVLWGCTLETIARAVLNETGHVIGPNIPSAVVRKAGEMNRTMGIKPQQPVQFDQSLDWYIVRAFTAA